MKTGMSGTTRRMAARAAAAVAVVVLAALPARSEMRLPPIERTSLSNGMVLIVMEDARLPLVNFRMAIRGGSASDPEGLGGLADLTATLIRKGAGEHTAIELAETVEYMGGELDSYAEKDFALVAAEFRAEDAETGLNILGDVVLRPRFDRGEFEREKSKAQGILERLPDDPYALADREFEMFLLGEHPYAHPTNGTRAGVRRVKWEDVIAFHNRCYRPQGAVLAVVGDVDPAEVLSAVREIFGGWVPSEENPRAIEAPAVPTGRRVLLIDKPDATQTQIRIGNMVPPRGHSDYLPLTVANVLFGGGFTSRLIDEIRVNRGLSYSPHSSLYGMAEAGVFVVREYTRNEQAMETIEVTLDLIEELRNEPISQEEIEKTKNYVTGLFPLRLERPESMASRLLEVELYGLGEDYLGTYAEKVRRVTAADLSRVIEENIRFGDLTFVIVGAADHLEEPLSRLGEVEVREIGDTGDRD